MVPGAGHYPQSQRPGVTTGAVLRFLESVNSPKNLTSTRPPYDRRPRAAPEQPPTALRSGLSATAVPPQALGALCFQHQEHRGRK